jgi:hypothetical protein
MAIGTIGGLFGCLNFVPAVLTIVDSVGSADLAGSSVALSVPQVNRRKR